MMNRFKKVQLKNLPVELESITDDELDEYREAFRLFDKVSYKFIALHAC